MFKVLVIYAAAVVATSRLNRLVVHDTITAPLRSWLATRSNFPGRLASAATMCTWCTGIYTAAATTAYAHWAAGWPWHLYPLTFLSVAWLAPVAAHWLEG